MSSIVGSLPYDLTNGTTADATQVMANYNTIVTDVNANGAESGANSSITSLSGLTTPLSVGQGGTGASTLAAVVAEILPYMYPVGALYVEITGTNPGTTLGFGTWAAYAAGQALIGVGSFTDGDGNSETITGGQQIGEYQHTLVTNEIPSHTHTASVSDPGHSHSPAGGGGFMVKGAGSSFSYNSGSQGQESGNTTTVTTGVSVSNANTGGGAAHNNIQPSIGVYVWRRTA
jgi:microcystin-dependent protein